MSLMSMTGFGRASASDDELEIVIEVKTVNHRFKDFKFRMSNVFNQSELEFRKILSHHFKRGSFDISIQYKKLKKRNLDQDLDLDKVKNFISSMKPLMSESMSLRPTDFLRQEFLVDLDDEALKEKMGEMAKSVLSEACEKLKQSRASEGDKLAKTLKDHIEQYKTHFKVICDKSDDFKKMTEEKLRLKLEEFKDEIPVDKPRFMQEVVFYLEKMDIHEEINRVTFHLDKFNEIFNLKTEKGRKFEFLLQELGRETNTIGSKSSAKEISDCVIEMKVQLEKIREQALNIE